MTTALEQGTGTVTVGVQVYGGFTDGKPAYGSSSDISAQVVFEDRVMKNSDGEDVRTTLTLWVDGGELPLPDHQDQVTVSGIAHIVEFRRKVTDIDGALDHVLAFAREQ